MCELDAYRRSLEHSHDWQPLGEGDLEWCPGCGRVRHRPEQDAGAQL